MYADRTTRLGCMRWYRVQGKAQRLWTVMREKGQPWSQTPVDVRNGLLAELRNQLRWGHDVEGSAQDVVDWVNRYTWEQMEEIWTTDVYSHYTKQ